MTPDPHDRRPIEQADEPQKEAHIDKLERRRRDLRLLLRDIADLLGAPYDDAHIPAKERAAKAVSLIKMRADIFDDTDLDEPSHSEMEAEIERMRNHLQRDWTTFNYVLDGDVSPVKTEEYARKARDRLANALDDTDTDA